MPERENRSDPKIPSLIDQEIEEITKRIDALLAELVRKQQELMEKWGVSSQEMKILLDNPQMYPNNQSWEKFQAKRKQMREELWKKLGKDAQKAFELLEAEKEKIDIKRKTIGTRKNWIPLR
ncbi:MAG: hypothetical protein KDK40_00505 [Chlamydiia bacterium]|nr:hypothetical protein [Chlamydiia bacterium]